MNASEAKELSATSAKEIAENVANSYLQDVAFPAIREKAKLGNCDVYVYESDDIKFTPFVIQNLKQKLTSLGYKVAFEAGYRNDNAYLHIVW